MWKVMSMPDGLRTEARINYDMWRARIASIFDSSSGHAPVLLNSLPKSGTHLAIKLLEELPGISRVRLQFSRLNQDLFVPRGNEPTVDLGVVWPHPASRAKVFNRLSRLPRGAFVTGHIPYDPHIAEFLDSIGVRMVVLMRDPRDVAVSSAKYLASATWHPLHSRFSVMSEAERLMAAIVGFAPGAEGHGFKSLRERVTSITAWGDAAIAHQARFEDLVGPLGGGTEAAQLAAVNGIADHVGAFIDVAAANRIAAHLHGGTPTFRKGQTGSWNEYLGAEHVSAAGPLIEDLLIDLGYESNTTWWR